MMGTNESRFDNSERYRDLGCAISYYRKRKGLTQEQLAEKLSVTRQTLAKWENGEASPTIDDCIRMADIFDITVNDLAADIAEEDLDFVAPKGKHIFGLVTVGERGQIVIPKDARDIFKIKPGDKLLVLGDEEQGIAIVKADAFQSFASVVLEGLKKKGEL